MPKPKAPRLKGQALARAFAATYAHLGEVWATYEGGGWISFGGSKLKTYPDLAAMYPNGWCMLDRVRTTEARKRILEACRP